MERNYIFYYLPTVIENEMKYILYSPKKSRFFFSHLNAIFPAVCSFGMHFPPFMTWRHSVMKHSMKKNGQKSILLL